MFQYKALAQSDWFEIAGGLFESKNDTFGEPMDIKFMRGHHTAEEHTASQPCTQRREHLQGIQKGFANYYNEQRRKLHWINVTNRQRK